jgi:hypothetical protein
LNQFLKQSTFVIRQLMKKTKRAIGYWHLASGNKKPKASRQSPKAKQEVL